MAEIRSFKSWRYRPSLLKNIGELTSPLFDVASEKQREALYGNPLNSIHLSIPRGDQPAKNAAAIFDEWKQKNYIIQDQVPGIYVYYQYLNPNPIAARGLSVRSESMNGGTASF